ncbi:ribosomal protein S18-alanine N-acetyltransferase [Pseudarthrobacter sp. P1]|uniref:ribosomal protein S18-alanine N-acetyltransferase n=1 Tax=Pseudarthrobacter sp. P1 TaxID=3418418 RepID=UPI003CF26517
MVAADIDLITELDRQLFAADCWPRQMFVDELAQPETRRYVVAEQDGAVVGYAGLMCIRPIADIQTIGVLPQFQGRGTARAMLTELIEESRRRGAEDVMLEVSAANPRAQDLYRRYGFEQIHQRPRYYKDGSDALIMRLRLHEEPNATTTEDRP